MKFQNISLLFIFLLFNQNVHSGSSANVMPMGNMPMVGNIPIIDTIFNQIIKGENFVKSLEELGIAAICGTFILFSLHSAIPKGNFDQVTLTGICIGIVGLSCMGYAFGKEQNFRHTHYPKGLEVIKEIHTTSPALEKIIDQNKIAIEQLSKTVEKLNDKVKKYKGKLNNQKTEIDNLKK